VTETDDNDGVPRHRDGLRHRREAAINRNGEEMRQSTEDEGQRPTTIYAAHERGIRQPAIPATATATATDGKHWVAGGVASGGSGNGILLWRITWYWGDIILAIIKLVQKVLYFFRDSCTRR
jgi:hypothetical protein